MTVGERTGVDQVQDDRGLEHRFVGVKTSCTSVIRLLAALWHSPEGQEESINPVNSVIEVRSHS